MPYIGWYGNCFYTASGETTPFLEQKVIRRPQYNRLIDAPALGRAGCGKGVFGREGKPTESKSKGGTMKKLIPPMMFACLLLLATQVQASPVPQSIDLKPGSNPNCVNPDSRGRVAVAIFSTDDFDATQVDPDTVQFSGAGALRCKLEDALMEGPTWVFTQDGLLDLVCHFRTRQVGWPADGSDCGTLELTGESFDGTPIQGTDTACLPGENTCNTSTPIPVP